ncbi:uncharacterized protein LOC141903509 [Tubulanus polymorphus]|uniref:uncharacterized protein LOC141903509 n=1 Tax=Tubulanus polymorphus TaxID=672921 RepID=UPI003DA3CC31
MGGGERGRKPVVGPSPRKRRQEATTTTGAADDICLDYDVCDDEFEAEYDENYSDEAMMETEDDDTAAVDSTAVLPESSAVVEGMPPSLDDTIVDETDGDSSSKHAKLEGIIANVNIDDADVSMSSDKSCRSSMEVSTSEENSKTKRGKDSSDTELDYDSYSSVDEMERAGGEDSQTDGDNSQTDDWNYSSSSSNSSDRSSTSKDDSDSLSMDEVFGMNLERSENIKTVDEIESPDISESESPEQQNVVTETTDVNFESNGTKAIANRLHCSGDSMSASESKVNHFEIATCNKSKDIHVSFESTEHEKICAGESDAQTPKNLDNVLMDIPLRHCKGELDLRLPTPISSSNVTKYQSVSEHVLICRVKKVHNRRSSVHEMGRKSAERLIPESPSKRRSSVHELNFSKEEKCNELSSHDFESCEKSVTETKSEPCTETMNLNRSKDYVHMNKDDCDNKFSKKDKEVNMDERSDRRRGRKEHSAERPDRKRSDHRKEKKHKDHKESVRRHDVDKSQRRDPPEEKSHKSRRGDIDRSIPSNEKEIRSRQSEPRNREGSRHSGTRDMSKRTDRRTGSHRQETDEIKPRKHESDRKREEKCVNEPRRHSSTRERRQKHAEKHKCEPEEKSGRKIDIREDRRKECLDKQTSRTREERDRENAPQRRHSGDRPSGRKEMRKERDEIQRRRRYSDERSDRPRCRSDRHGSRGGSTPRSSDRVKLIVEEKERRGLDCQKHERSNERGSTPSSRRRSDRHGSRSGSTPGNSDRAKDIEERSERGGLDSEKQERSNEKGSSLSSRSKRERHRSLGGSAPRSSDRVKQIEDERERRGLDGEKHERSNEKRSSPSSRSRRERHGSREVEVKDMEAEVGVQKVLIE